MTKVNLSNRELKDLHTALCFAKLKAAAAWRYTKASGHDTEPKMRARFRRIHRLMVRIGNLAYPQCAKSNANNRRRWTNELKRELKRIQHA